MSRITEIDGAVMEGGGQILRLAISFSSLLKKPIRIYKIRTNRNKSGLRPQHLKGIEMVSQMCTGTLSGAAVGSTEISYHPKNIKAGYFEVDTQTAGSISLLIQVGLPIALFAPSHTSLLLKGGTNADMAPPIDYIINVFLPTLKKFGGNCDCRIQRRGYYPKGGGVVEVQVSPITTLSPINITLFGIVTRIWGRSYVAGTLPIKMAHNMADVAERILSQIVTKGVPINIDRVKESSQEAFGNGSGIVLFAETDTGCILGGTAIGNRNISTEDVATQAAEELADSLKGQYCVDKYCQDQIVILMALTDGKSVVKCGPLTDHTKTAIYIAEMLTDAKFKVQEKTDSVILECEGIGFRRNH